jgi:two-component system chemotaxis response regulator CheB
MAVNIRVLIVDDSAFMRKCISDMINGEPDIEVAGVARNGDEAIQKVKMLKPDVITLDVEMPGKNGLEVLKDIKNISDAQVIMLSGLTARGSSITIESLSIGAFDFVQKPSGFKSLMLEEIRDELLRKVRHAAKNKKQNPAEQFRVNLSRIDLMPSSAGKIQAVALGASTGGPKVLYEVITMMPRDIGVPIFVVQHMPTGFTKAFAERLDSNSLIEVTEAKDGDVIRPGIAYVAPGGFHMLINGNKILLDTSPAVHGVRPAVDKLLLSCAGVYREKFLCCIFTGMGRDGAEGVKAVKSHGGIVMAQDEATSAIYGMPKAAYDTGCVDMVLPGHKIAQEIVRMVKHN